MDNDGLSDYDEINIYQTSPVLSDTDGDGFSDGREIVELGYNSQTNPYRFNPLIADIPKIKVELVSLPDVLINYTRSDSTTQSVTTGWDSSHGTVQTTSSCSESTYSAELSLGVSMGVEAEISITPSATVSTEWNVEATAGYESTSSFSREQSVEASETYSESRVYEESSEYSYEDGELNVQVLVSNIGDISFTLDSISLSAFERNPGSPSVISENFGNMVWENAYGNEFSSQTIGPNSSEGPWSFVTDLNLDQAHYLLKNLNNLVLSPTSELLNIDGVPYAQYLTDVRSRTASIIIDYGVDSGLNPDRYFVATNNNPDAPGVTLADIMNSILEIDYETGTEIVAGSTNSCLTSVNNIEKETGKAAWLIIHLYEEGGNDRQQIYSPVVSFDFDSIEINSSDTVYLLYVLDNDGDGLTSRQELMYGTSDDDPDTDDDEQTDAYEVANGTSPLLTPTEEAALGANYDSDGDGLSDIRELGLGTNPALADSDEDELSDGNEVDVYHTDPLNSQTDADGDGLLDSKEIGDGLKIGQAWDRDTDGDLTPNYLDSDSDNDGINDGDEVTQGINYLLYDTDGDGCWDMQDTYPLNILYWSPIASFTISNPWSIILNNGINNTTWSYDDGSIDLHRYIDIYVVTDVSSVEDLHENPANWHHVSTWEFDYLYGGIATWFHYSVWPDGTFSEITMTYITNGDYADKVYLPEGATFGYMSRLNTKSQSTKTNTGVNTFMVFRLRGVERDNNPLVAGKVIIDNHFLFDMVYRFNGSSFEHVEDNRWGRNQYGTTFAGTDDEVRPWYRYSSPTTGLIGDGGTFFTWDYERSVEGGGDGALEWMMLQFYWTYPTVSQEGFQYNVSP